MPAGLKQCWAEAKARVQLGQLKAKGSATTATGVSTPVLFRSQAKGTEISRRVESRRGGKGCFYPAYLLKWGQAGQLA